MALPGPAGPPPPTVLVAVRARVSRPPRLGPAPASASAPADAPARLQLSVEPGPGGQQRFRLVLRHTDPRPSGSLVEFDLKDISYTVKSPTCHELAAAGCAEEPMVLTFEEEREAQKWWTVVSSSLREVQKAAETTGILAAQPPPLSSVIGSPAAAPEEEASLELSKTEDLALRLSLAIEVGNEQAASQCAMALARQQASLRIQPKESSHPTNEISMKVCVEDATCSANITLRVHTHMTVATLKQQVFQDYKFHPSVQRWIIGQCLCVDERTVSSYGIRKDGDTAFLYLLSVKQAGLSEQRFQEDLTQAQAALRPAASLTDSAGVDDKRRCSTLPAAAPRKVWVSDSGRKMNIDEISNHLNLLQVNNLLYNHPLGALATAAPPSPVQTGWSCPKCTFINKPTRPGCEMCSADRPPGYVVPGGYTPDEMELWRMQQEKDGIRQYQQALEDQRLQNFQRLKQLDEAALVPNQETLECLICYQTVAPGAGVLLRECLHNFCRDCLRQVISYSEEPQVACPFRDDTYACSSHLQEREIRALVSPEEYQRFLGRGLAVAEQRVPNSYHCRTADCPGWCVYEDAVNEFRCPLCAKLNCLLCKAIHEGQNCRQYQDNLRLQAHDDVAARQTNDMLQMLVQCGEAMHCPACRIVVQKKDGCDWIRCTVCHTEICWVTKGPRWGPGGPGDTSGGCRCNVNGQRCHPHCQNCH